MAFRYNAPRIVRFTARAAIDAFSKWFEDNRIKVLHTGIKYHVGGWDSWDLVIEAPGDLPAATYLRIEDIDPTQPHNNEVQARGRPKAGKDAQERFVRNGVSAITQMDRDSSCYRNFAMQHGLAARLEYALFCTEFQVNLSGPTNFIR